MSHRIIITATGEGEGGSATGTIEWAPSHGISPADEARRRERAEKLLNKANDILYGPQEGNGNED